MIKYVFARHSMKQILGNEYRLNYYKNIFVQEKHIQQLKKAIRDKEAPLKVSQTRLEARTHRPDVELCRDPPYHRLVDEVGQIQESLDLLNRKLNEAEHSHQVNKVLSNLVKYIVTNCKKGHGWYLTGFLINKDFYTFNLQF
jgi:hypothetical protein